jgi:O-antigen/teichoic acid export membrane protein
MGIELRRRLTQHLERLTGSKTGAALAHKAGNAFLINIAGTGIAFALQVLLARLLGVEDFGQYIYALTWINLLLLVGKMGLDTAALRFVPEYSANAQWALLRGFVAWSTRTALMASMLVAFVTAAFVLVIGDHMEPGLPKVFLWACLLLPFWTYLTLQGAYLQALRHIVHSQAPQVILRPVFLGAALLVIVYFTDITPTASIAMATNIVTTMAAIVAMAYLSRAAMPQEFFSGEKASQAGTWTKVMFPMLFITSFNLVINQTDIIMVGALLTTKEAGIYSAVSRITLLIPFAIILVNSVTAPVISQLYSQKKLQQLQRMMTLIAWGSFVVAVPLFAGIVFGSRPLLSLFGPEFITGSTALVILAVARLVTALTGSVGYLLSMSGHQNQAAYILGASALVNIVFNGILIPPYGMIGASVASLVSTILWTGAMVIYARKTIGINPLISMSKERGV